jgi:hypothetical protein
MIFMWILGERLSSSSYRIQYLSKDGRVTDVKGGHKLVEGLYKLS